MARYWLIWFISSFTTFIVPESYWLARGVPGNTLSGAIWSMEKLTPGQPITAWTAAHFLFTLGFLVISLWLTGHFGWHIWAGNPGGR